MPTLRPFDPAPRTCGLQGAQKVQEHFRSFFARCSSRRARLSGAEGVGNVEAEVNVVVGRLRGGPDEFRCQVWVRAGSDAELAGSGGQLEGCEEFHDDRALGKLDEGFLECDGAHSRLVSLRDWHVEKDGQELRPTCDFVGFEDVIDHWERVHGASFCLVESLGECVAPSAWAGFCRATHVLTVPLRQCPLGLDLGGLGSWLD